MTLGILSVDGADMTFAIARLQLGYSRPRCASRGGIDWFIGRRTIRVCLTTLRRRRRCLLFGGATSVYWSEVVIFTTVVVAAVLVSSIEELTSVMFLAMRVVPLRASVPFERIVGFIVS
jgi:hypothetical protein